MKKRVFGQTLRSKLLMLTSIAVLPLLVLVVYLLASFQRYSTAYTELVSNMTIASSYNLDFRDQVDESCYKLVVGYVTFSSIDADPTLENPYVLLKELKSAFTTLKKSTEDEDSLTTLNTLLRNIETLEERIQILEANIEEGGKYDENIAMLDNSVYVLTELIQDNIQYYIFYQARSIDRMQAELNSSVYSFTFYTTIMLVAILLIILIASINMIFAVLDPIKELVTATENVAQGDFTVRSQVVTDDELGKLSESFNSMTTEIQSMVEHIKEDERKMRNAEIRLLQEQINPHFLYNALDTIVWLVEVGENDKAVNMVMSLSSFFRMILSHGREYISIKDEELHIKSYLEIQQIRYADIMDFDIDISPDIYDYTILKMTLQPVVENALYHGIKYKRAKGHIQVTGYMEGNLIHIVVEDDGIGIDTDGLKTLRSNIMKPCSETDEGFGLANVNERIRMNFGEEYGMTINSVVGEGTVVEVIIPAIPINDMKGGAPLE